MEKNIKDFIHFYLGCECVNSSFPKGHLEYDKGWKFRGIDLTTPKSFLIETETEYTFSESIMLKLRKLESMTDEEAIEGGWSGLHSFEYYCKGNNGAFHPGDFHYLLSKGFDLFGLLDSGLAIEKQPTTQR